ncbi:hypothetical protein [Nonomuraea turcica]|uniref:hypothetical protein n=1 Tax=Nonomuraea sp. G32 TaxID=3067274 RepID=UPI00273AE305|nr:hypothetical protein [Nonomuraea sp. G32]MDP4504067.1 hypothetical protein [Nonomuraea sp. G32]
MSTAGSPLSAMARRWASIPARAPSIVAARPRSARWASGSGRQPMSETAATNVRRSGSGRSSSCFSRATSSSRPSSVIS